MSPCLLLQVHQHVFLKLMLPANTRCICLHAVKAPAASNIAGSSCFLACISAVLQTRFRASKHVQSMQA